MTHPEILRVMFDMFRKDLERSKGSWRVIVYEQISINRCVSSNPGQRVHIRGETRRETRTQVQVRGITFKIIRFELSFGFGRFEYQCALEITQ